MSPAAAGEEVQAGEFLMRKLFTELAVTAEKKVTAILTTEPLEKPLTKCLQRGEDAAFDNLLQALGSVAEHCLPSLLRILLQWRERQLAASSELIDKKMARSGGGDSQSKASGKVSLEAGEKMEQVYMIEKRDLAIEFIFCLVLIEVLKQFSLHPGHEDLTSYIENLAFKQFRFRESIQLDPNLQNINIIADLYSEVIGVLVQTRFQSVRKRFMAELKELRSKESSPLVVHEIISLLMGMKFFRVKMVPIEEFEASFSFMQDCASFFLEVKDKDIKHALAGLFVEILVPVAAVVKNEVNVPCLKNFVESLYSPTLDLCTKKKYMLALFPLVTCLLCVSQKNFFLQNWHYFLVMCLAHLKNRDPKMSRVALESLYRLLWVYIIRIKCESNTATASRLQSIVNSLFPKGSKAVVPRDTPLNIFVKIIQFVSQERLDFAMREIVFDLLSVGRPIKFIFSPERMSIGLRSFLVVADSLQQKEGEPPMPRTVGPLPSGNTMRVKKTFLNKMLTDEVARDIGMSHYYPYVRKALNDILRALDVQFGRPLMATAAQNVTKEPDRERKPKIDLFRTCVAAIPRLMPDGMSKEDLINLLSRLTLHVDEEMRALAFQALQNLITDFPDWRPDIVDGFLTCILQEISDNFPLYLDNSLKMLLQLLSNWKNTMDGKKEKVVAEVTKSQSVLHQVEGLSLVMLCSGRTQCRRVAVMLLKEVRSAWLLFPSSQNQSVADVLDRAAPAAVEAYFGNSSPGDKNSQPSSGQVVDLQWLVEKNSSVWNSAQTESESFVKSASQDLFKDEFKVNAWLNSLMFMLKDVPRDCPVTTDFAWTIINQRMNSVFPQLETSTVLSDRASVLLRGNSSLPKKSPSERSSALYLWRSYLMMACQMAPSTFDPTEATVDPDPNSSLEGSVNLTHSVTENKCKNKALNPSQLFSQVLPLIKSETYDIRSAAVIGLSFVNELAVIDLLADLLPYIREAVDRKQENMRRKKRRDMLRTQLGHLMQLLAKRKTLGSYLVERDSGLLTSVLIEFIDGSRSYLENESDKDVASPLYEVKQTFCVFVSCLVENFRIEHRSSLMSRDLRRQLFFLFASWSGELGRLLHDSKGLRPADSNPTYFETCSLRAMCSILCCGPIFSPSFLSEDSSLYAWLEFMMDSPDESTAELGQKTLVILLEANPDVGPLLDWVVDCCYTKAVRVAERCFMALAMIFCLREYPCDHYIAIINLTLTHVGNPRPQVHQMAIELLQVLDSRFFDTKAKDVLELQMISEDTDNDEDDEESAAEDEQTIRLRHVIALKKLSSTKKPVQEKTQKTFEPLLCETGMWKQPDTSERMASRYGHLTMNIFSDVTFRFQTARSSVCKVLLQNLIPWLKTAVELVDPHTVLTSSSSNEQDVETKEGWGSPEATEMILNNLFYMTIRFVGDYPAEIENVWTALCTTYPNNVKIILRYLFVMTALAPTELSPHTKKVASFVARAKTDRFVDEIMAELQSVESLNCFIERTETPPFYRLIPVRKTCGHLEDDCTSGSISGEGGKSTVINMEEGTLHTKRHSTDGSADRRSKLDPHVVVDDPSTAEESLTSEADAIEQTSDYASKDKETTPHPLPPPMPEFGGFYANLTEFLPSTCQPAVTVHRCHLALALLSDVVNDFNSIDWAPHIPVMLHIIFLGLDHSRPFVSINCQQTLLNMLLTCVNLSDFTVISKILIANKNELMGFGLTTCTKHEEMPNFLDPPYVKRDGPSRNNSLKSAQRPGDLKSPGPASEGAAPNDCLTRDSQSKKELSCIQTAISSPEQLLQHLISFLSMSKSPTLWNYEDITSKVWSIRSAEQLSYFLQHVIPVFKITFPAAKIEERWSEVALQLALSCSSRHYAGRSLQIFRALKMSLHSRTLADILSRLVETVSEQGEDMQGYVTELMLTLESSVDVFDSNATLSDVFGRIFKSAPSLNVSGTRRSAPPLLSAQRPLDLKPSAVPSLPERVVDKHHTRSTSVSFGSQKGGHSRDRSATETSSRISPSQLMLGRSKSVQSLKESDENLPEAGDRNALLAKFFWISVAMLETDYEHEFLLAVRLLDKTLSKLPLEHTDCREKVEKLGNQIRWPGFAGIHALLLKGCTSASTFECTIRLLHRLTPLLELPLVDPSETGQTFPFTVMALLPHLLAHFDDPSPFCISAVDALARWSSDKSPKLENLATVMNLYSRRSFNKESFQWTKCIVKYLFDAFSHVFDKLLSFLVEVSNARSHLLYSCDFIIRISCSSLTRSCRLFFYRSPIKALLTSRVIHCQLFTAFCTTWTSMV